MLARELAFWSAFPWLLPQALYVRRTAPRFAPASGPSHGDVPGERPLRLLGIGDSIIAGVGVKELPHALVGQTAQHLATQLGRGVRWQTLGLSGATSEEVREQLLPNWPETQVDLIVVSVGVNDLTGLYTGPRWRRSLSALLRDLSARAPEAFIGIAGIPPFHAFPLLPEPLRALFGYRAESFDRIARVVVAEDPRRVYLPMRFSPDPAMFSDDGYHPSEAGYSGFGAAMAEALATASRQRGSA